MNTNEPLDRKVERELERERAARAALDEQRTGLAPCEDLRSKDARENAAAANLRRPAGA